jgi:hypothetical protein
MLAVEIGRAIDTAMFIFGVICLTGAALAALWGRWSGRK